MKCIAAVVMAFVACVSAGNLPLVYSGLPLGAPLAYAAAPAIGQYASIPESKIIASTSYAAPLTYAAAPYAGLGLPLAYNAPLAYTTGYRSVLPYAAPALTTYATFPGEPKYTAINRGALHEAPLPGHGLSQTSINLQPAPGTL